MVCVLVLRRVEERVDELARGVVVGCVVVASVPTAGRPVVVVVVPMVVAPGTVPVVVGTVPVGLVTVVPGVIGVPAAVFGVTPGVVVGVGVPTI